MDVFVKNIILSNGLTEKAINDKKELFDCKKDDENIKYELKKQMILPWNIDFIQQRIKYIFQDMPFR